MNVLIIGGTGLISTGIVTHLLARGARVTVYNRGQRQKDLPPGIAHISGDRNDSAAFVRAFANLRFDAVIDMICFNEEQARATVSAFKNRCEQLIFCSTVCTYGVKVPPRVLIDESFAQEPTFGYGSDKVTCERIFREAHAAGAFKSTIIRPSNTYGPSSSLIDQLEFNAVAWDRLERGLPILIADGGMGLWQATHRDDCGKLFAYAVLNPKTYGKDYNATRDEVFTWRDYYRDVATALGVTAKVVSLSSEQIIARDPARFGFLSSISRFHGAYSSDRAKADVPEFRCTISFVQGAKQTLDDTRQRGAWRDSRNDEVYDSLIAAGLASGVQSVEA